MVDISELQSGEVHLDINHFHWHWGEYLFLYVPHRNQKDIFVNIPKNGQKLIGWHVILSLRLLSGEWYHKDSCISHTFLLNFGPKIVGAAYTRDHNLSLVSRLPAWLPSKCFTSSSCAQFLFKFHHFHLSCGLKQWR